MENIIEPIPANGEIIKYILSPNYNVALVPIDSCPNAIQHILNPLNILDKVYEVYMSFAEGVMGRNTPLEW